MLAEDVKAVSAGLTGLGVRLMLNPYSKHHFRISKLATDNADFGPRSIS
jgi:hypothetical protein